MAANINNGAQRFDYARTERDDDNNNNEAATLDGQSAQPTESTIAAPSEQQSQSGGDGYGGGGNGANAHDPSTPSPVPLEADALAPSYMRFGIGDTVIMGRPDYVRMQIERERAQAVEDEPSPREPGLREPSLREPNPRLTALAPTPRAENAPTAPTPPATNTPQPAKPIPMPKPSGMAPGTFVPLPTPAPAATFPPITNAPRIGGEAVRQALATDQRNSASTTVTGIAPTASAAEITAVDAMLADPINRQLIDLAKQNYGPADSKSWVAEAQVKLYGEARFQDMMYLHRALPWVQNAYALAVTQAYLANGQPALTGNLTNNQGVAPPPSTFDINAFNIEYASRGDLMAQAFAAKFGGIPVTQEMGFSGTVSSGDDNSQSGASVPVFHVGNMFSISMTAVWPTGYADGQEQPPPTYFASCTPNTMQQYVLGQDIGDHRAMFDDTAVWFDPSLGFVTDPQNLKDDEESHFDRVMGVVGPIMLTGLFVMTANAALFGASGVFASSIAGFPAGSTGYAAIQGAVGGAVGTVANSAVTGRPLTWADLGRSMFTGGMMGGLINYTGLDTYGLDNSNPGVAVGSRQVIDWGERLTAIVGRGTMQGILQQVTGGRFRDGLANGLAQGLGGEISRALSIEINRWAAENNVAPVVASQLRMIGQGFASALVRSAANGGQGGVEAFLSDLINSEIGEAITLERAEVNTLTTRYNDALRNNDVNTQAAVLNNLVDRWMRNHREDTPEQALTNVIQGLGWTVDASRFTRDANGQLVAAVPGGATVDRPTAVARIAAAYQRNDPALSQQEAERLANDYINRRGIPSVFVEMMIPEIVVRPDKPLPFTTGSEIVDRIIGAVQGSVMTGYNYVSGLLHGVKDITLLSADGLLDIVNKLIGEDIFPDSAQRNAARADMLNNLVANLDQLPAQVANYFNDRLEVANQLEAKGDLIGAARERTELIGDLISMITNPRAPSVMRILERVGIDANEIERILQRFERTPQTQRVFRDAMLNEERRLNPNFAHVDATLFEAHHTIPVNAFPFLDELRTRLQNWGIDINSVENGVMLPGRNAPTGLQGTYHGTLGDSGYGRELQRRFVGVNDAASARQVLAAINNELRNGTFQFTKK